MKKMIKLFLFLFSMNAFAMPANVVIIRHAEKPESGHILSPEGEKRALLIVDYVIKSQDMKAVGLPNFIFASNPKDEESSVRSIQTVTPLAKALKLTINTNYVADDYKKMVAEILSNPIYNQKNIFIAWGHKKIDKIAKKLGVTNYPDEWSDDDYDSVWIVNYKNNAVNNFSIVKQNINLND